MVGTDKIFIFYCKWRGAVSDIGMRQVEEFASKSKQSIKILPDSVYKEKLYNLVDYILSQK